MATSPEPRRQAPSHHTRSQHTDPRLGHPIRHRSSSRQWYTERTGALVASSCATRTRRLRERLGAGPRATSENAGLPTYILNTDAVRHAKRLIDARQYVLRSRWQNVQPRAREENAFLENHTGEEYSAWHLGLTEGAAEETKARYAFVYGDLRRVHRMGLIACHYRAAEWRHKEIELAAHELLQYLDRKTAS
jgi:hypothetical protein